MGGPYSAAIERLEKEPVIDLLSHNVKFPIITSNMGFGFRGSRPPDFLRYQKSPIL